MNLTDVTASHILREIPARPGYRTAVLADPLYALIHRTESAQSVARVLAPGGQTFSGGTGIPLRFFEDLDRAVALSIPGSHDLASIVVSSGALCVLGSYFLDPESHFEGARSLPHSVAQERLRVLWHERVWQALNLLPRDCWQEVVQCLETAESDDLDLLRTASRKSDSSPRAADLLAKAIVEYRQKVDLDRLIPQVFPRHLQDVVWKVSQESRPRQGEIDAIVEAASQLGTWPPGFDLTEWFSGFRLAE